MCVYRHMCCHFKRKTELQAIFLNPFTICSSCKRQFVVCLFVDQETKGSYLFTNGLNGLNRLNGLIGLNGLNGLNGLIQNIDQNSAEPHRLVLDEE